MPMRLFDVTWRSWFFGIGAGSAFGRRYVVLSVGPFHVCVQWGEYDFSDGVPLEEAIERIRARETGDRLG